MSEGQYRRCSWGPGMLAFTGFFGEERENTGNLKSRLI
jgi:hypothetical protein